MISEAVQTAINNQIQAELYSSYLYLSMAAYCDSINLRGFANWMRVQSQEETGHAMKLYDYLNDRGGRILLKAIEQPPQDFQSPLDVFQKTLEHERQVTARIVDLYRAAQNEGDPTTQAMLQWYLTEQVEEEATATQIVEMLSRIGSSGSGLVMLDHELGERKAAGS